MIATKVGDVTLSVLDQGQGPTLLLAHGFPLDHSMWRGQIAALAHDYRVIAPDLRGFGQSEVSAGTVSMERFADDLAAVLDAFEIGQPVTFCGLSMGGYIGWQFWRRHRSRLQRLVLCDTRAGADTEEAAKARLETAEHVLQHGSQSLVENMVPKLFAPATLENPSDIVSATREVMRQSAPHGIAAALRGMASRTDFSALLIDIDVPTLVVCGQYDALSTTAEMRQIAEAIPNARFVEVPDAGHMSPLEQPERVNAAMREFLAAT